MIKRCEKRDLTLCASFSPFCQESSQPRLFPHWSERSREVQNGAETDEKRATFRIKTDQKVKNQAYFTGARLIVALLRCLFPEQIPALFPSQELFAEGGDPLCATLIKNVKNRRPWAHRPAYLTLTLNHRPHLPALPQRSDGRWEEDHYAQHDPHHRDI